ncbi:MAG: helix-turn-helix domain-containing protein [Treponema sp.]|nr:helix-turn-helix domain-containing protein [Treponema sp.]
MSFSENLRDAIDYNGLEQKELAYKTKISLRGIENYLRKNGSIPSADKAVQIAQVLGVTVEYLVTGKNLPAGAVSPEASEVQKLINCIKKLPKSKQQIVIQNALNLAGILSR